MRKGRDLSHFAVADAVGEAGIARTGSFGEEGSGDLFVAFSSGNEKLIEMKMLPLEQLNPIFEAVVDATTEAILNALCAAEDMVGFKQRKAFAIPLDRLQAAMA
jgi:D-aminopeptidase